MARKLQLSKGLAPRYAGTCRHLSQEVIDQYLNEGKKPAWRFIIPDQQWIEFDDAVRGHQRFNSDDIGDFIIRRADGSSPFLFSNAIDDATMAITHVIRGEDHLANTPRQILLLQTLNLSIPHYAHLSLIMGEDGSLLSKREGSFSLQDMRKKGFLPMAIVNYLTRLGHTCDTAALLDIDDLSQHFYLDKLSKSSAHFDMAQLMFWQKLVVQSLDVNALWHWLTESVMNQVPEKVRDLFAETVKTNIAFPYDALEWAKILFHEMAPMDQASLKIIDETGEQFFVEAELAVDQYGIDLPLILKELQVTLGVSGKKLFMPLRVALTGRIHGPELAPIAQLLGKEKMKHRLGRAVLFASGKG